MVNVLEWSTKESELWSAIVPWPDFSELSFGFGFLREFERKYTPGGRFTAAPDFITQSEEATEGYDVAVLNGTTPVFFQFKRSFVLSTRRATEIQNGDFDDPPVYRMHLRKKESYRQHAALQNLERQGNLVFYVTSQIASHNDLTEAYMHGTILEAASALFAPSEIALPDIQASHHLCFKADEDEAILYSEEGRRFSRKYPRWEFAVERGFLPGRRTAEDNRAALSRVADSLAEESATARDLARRHEDPVVRASVLSLLVLDAQLTFFGQE